jgi:hypothetical protein
MAQCEAAPPDLYQVSGTQVRCYLHEGASGGDAGSWASGSGGPCSQDAGNEDARSAL